MLDRNRVYELFSLFSDLEGSAANRYRPLCDGATDALERRIKPDVGPEDTERLNMAAAAAAYCDWQELTASGFSSGDELKVGDITLKSSSGSVKTSAVDVREYFESRIADLLEPPYVFGSTCPEEYR